MSAGFLAGDSVSECVWGEDETGARFEIALPPGWTSSVDPIAIYGADGNVFAREGDNLAGGAAQTPWWRSGAVLCELEDAVATVRFSDMEAPTSHLDDELGP